MPVLDRDRETVYGLVDIAQCLYDAIIRIEQMQKSQVDFLRSVQRAHVRWSSSISDDPEGTAVMAQQMVSDMMERIAPSIATITEKDNKVLLKLDRSCSVADAAALMGKHRHTAILGFDARSESNKNRILSASDYGIFTTKDLLSKVVSKGLDPAKILLENVMTRQPDTVDSNSSLLDALHIMHDGKFLHVPVTREEENQTVICQILDVLVLFQTNI